MKQKEAFTLIEVLAVISLVALLAIIGFPLVINQINKSKGKIDDTVIQTIKEAANSYIEMNPSKYPPKKGENYCISIKTLVESGYLKEPLINPSDGKKIDITKQIRVDFISDVEAEYYIGSCFEQVDEGSITDPAS